MNPRQKLARLIGLVALVAIGIVPPWQFTAHGKTGSPESGRLGFHPIWSPPVTALDKREDLDDVLVAVNVKYHVIHLGLGLVVLNFVVFALKTKPTT